MTPAEESALNRIIRIIAAYRKRALLMGEVVYQIKDTLKHLDSLGVAWHEQVHRQLRVMLRARRLNRLDLVERRDRWEWPELATLGDERFEQALAIVEFLVLFPTPSPREALDTTPA